VLDAADLDPFWAAADETGALIHIHPSYGSGYARVNNYGLANAADGDPARVLRFVAEMISADH